MTSSTVSPRAARRSVGLLPALVALAMIATGCGTGATEEAVDSSSTPAEGGFPGAAGGGFPGASGLIAAVDDRVLQVQNEQSGQVAVTLADDAVITDAVEASLDKVEVGSCVVVRPATSVSSSSESSSDTGAVTADTVAITDGDDGCERGGFGGGAGGEMPSDMPEMPDEMPSDMPEMPDDLPSDIAGGGFGVAGEVTEVSADGFTVASTGRPGEDGESATSEVTVTVSGTTTYTAQATATAAALKVGRCVQATGETDDTGAVTAEQVSVSDAVDGSCQSGLGGPGGFGGGRPGDEGA